MNTKIYNSPDFTVIDVENTDIITTSDIEAGIETPPVPDQGGSWETL